MHTSHQSNTFFVCVFPLASCPWSVTISITPLSLLHALLSPHIIRSTHTHTQTHAHILGEGPPPHHHLQIWTQLCTGYVWVCVCFNKDFPYWVTNRSAKTAISQAKSACTHTRTHTQPLYVLRIKHHSSIRWCKEILILNGGKDEKNTAKHTVLHIL